MRRLDCGVACTERGGVPRAGGGRAELQGGARATHKAWW